MWTLTRITLVALGLCFLGGGRASAGCMTFNQAKAGDAPLVGDCNAGFNGNQNQQMTQLASALGDNGQSSLVAYQGGALFPVNNGNGRWICTPSGFGHLATCGLRSGN
jgi:hypothetical protein